MLQIDTLAEWIAAAACVGGVGLGLYGLIDPVWAANLVRLRGDNQRPGGFAEFRATYGGLFFGAHSFALAVLLISPSATSAGACAALGFGWGLTAFGRLVSMILDKTDTGFNRFSVLFEAAFGAALVSPYVLAHF